MEGLLQVPYDFQRAEKTSYAVSHSRSMLVMSFCRLAWREKVVEALTDQLVGRSVEEVKA